MGNSSSVSRVDDYMTTPIRTPMRTGLMTPNRSGKITPRRVVGIMTAMRKNLSPLRKNLSPFRKTLSPSPSIKNI